MSSHVFQVTSHIVGLIALCTGTETLRLSRSVNSFTINLYETFGRVRQLFNGRHHCVACGKK